jgi:hypothetical protein
MIAVSRYPSRSPPSPSLSRFRYRSFLGDCDLAMPFAIGQPRLRTSLRDCAFAGSFATTASRPAGDSEPCGRITTHRICQSVLCMSCSLRKVCEIQTTRSCKSDMEGAAVSRRTTETGKKMPSHPCRTEYFVMLRMRKLFKEISDNFPNRARRTSEGPLESFGLSPASSRRSSAKVKICRECFADHMRRVLRKPQRWRTIDRPAFSRDGFASSLATEMPQPRSPLRPRTVYANVASLFLVWGEQDGSGMKRRAVGRADP